MYASLPLSPRAARHFPPCSGEATIKEEKIHIFIGRKMEKVNDSRKKAVLVGNSFFVQAGIISLYIPRIKRLMNGLFDGFFGYGMKIDFQERKALRRCGDA